MIPGCTHALDVTLDDQTINLNGAQDIYVTINQNGEQIDFPTDRVDVADNGYQFSVYLTQEETLRFRYGAAIAQVNWTEADMAGNISRLTTDPFVVEVGQQFMRQVL